MSKYLLGLNDWHLAMKHSPQSFIQTVSVDPQTLRVMERQSNEHGLRTKMP